MTDAPRARDAGVDELAVGDADDRGACTVLLIRDGDVVAVTSWR